MLDHQAVLGLTPHVKTLGVLLGLSLGAYSQIMFDIQKVVRLVKCPPGPSFDRHHSPSFKNPSNIAVEQSKLFAIIHS
jgi:hypothetical protein